MLRDPNLEDGYMQAVFVKMAGCNRHLVSAVPLATACSHSLFPNSLWCLEETPILAIIEGHLETPSIDIETAPVTSNKTHGPKTLNR